MSIIFIALTLAMMAVVYFDATRFIIPNWLVAGILILYPLAVYLSPNEVAWNIDILVMLSVFVVGYIIFALHLMGGGDVKLIIVLSLWAGLGSLADFIFWFTMLGGVLSIILLTLRRLLPLVTSVGLPRIFRAKQPVPYGLAIAAAFMMMLVSGKISAVPPFVW